MLWHTVEAKPYAFDVLIAAVVAFGYVRTRHWPMWKQCLIAMPIAPVMLWLSFPACFVVGGWFVGQLPALLRSRSWRDWTAALVLAAAVAGSFLALALGPVRAQHRPGLPGAAR